MLIQHPDWDADAVAKHLGSTVPNVRQSLDRLAELELIEKPGDGRDAIRVVNPITGLSALLGRSQAEFEHLERRIEQARTAIEVIAAEYDVSHPRSYEVMERLPGPDAVQRRYETMMRRVQREYVGIIAGAQARTLAADRPLVRQTLERGVPLRIIYQDSVRNHAPMLRYVEWLVEEGAQVRMFPTVPAPMAVFDQETALVPLKSADGPAEALEVRTPAIATALAVLFEQYWDMAAPFGTAPPQDDNGLSSLERALLCLWSHGMTDQASARELGVSLRTVRRMASDLMKRLGARSRFEAGVRVVERGWM
ncbi:LuxR C-terminal-related transcriptional regulator [Spirillospora sp. NPDC050679]